MTFKEFNQKLSEEVKDILAKYIQKSSEALDLLREATEKIECMDASERSCAEREYSMLLYDLEDCSSYNDTCKMVIENYLGESDKVVVGEGEIKK